MTMTLISHERFNLIDQKISFFLNRLPASKLPISLMAIMEVLSKDGVYFNTFDQYAELNRIPVGLVPLRLHTDHACLQYDKNSGEAYIYYNKDLSKCMKRWDISHEIGHYILGHYVSVGADSGYLSEQDIQRFEEEANYTAKQILAPDSLVIAVMAELDKTDHEFLYMVYRDLFKLSMQASLYCAVHMEKYFRYKRVNEGLIRKYWPLLKPYISGLSNECIYDRYFYERLIELDRYKKSREKHTLQPVSEIMARMGYESGFYIAESNSVM